MLTRAHERDACRATSGAPRYACRATSGAPREACASPVWATPALHCREEAFKPTTHAFICMYAFESASVIWSQTVREQRDCEDRRAHLSFSSHFAFMCTIPNKGPEVSHTTLVDSLFFSRSPWEEGRAEGRQEPRHAAMAEGTDGRDSAGRE